jgi:ribonuclease R
MALVELGQGRGRARVVRELGDPALASDVIDAMLEDRGVRRTFPRAVEGEAEEAPARAASQGVERRDLRDLATFTVDRARLRRRRLRLADRAGCPALDPHR